MNRGSVRGASPSTFQMTPYPGWESDFKRDWSTESATLCGHHIRRTWVHRFWHVVVPQRWCVPQTIGELQAAISSKVTEIQKERSSGWQFYATYATLPSTPRSPFGAYFGNHMTFVQSNQDNLTFMEWSPTEWSLTQKKNIEIVKLL